MKVLKICFTFDSDDWDEVRDLYTEDEVRVILHEGGFWNLRNSIGSRQEAELDEIIEEKND